MLEAKVPHVLPGSLTGTQPRMFHPPLPSYCLLQACCCALRAGKGRREALPAWITYSQEPQSGLSIRLWHWSLGENAMRSAAPFTATLLSTPSILALALYFLDSATNVSLWTWVSSSGPPNHLKMRMLRLLSPQTLNPSPGNVPASLGGA